MFVIHLLLTLAVLVIGRSVLSRERYKRQVQLKGGKLPKRYPHKDPIFGLDVFIETGKMFSDNLFFPITLNRFSSIGRTFDLDSLGKRTIHSIEPENIQQVFATDSANWGVAQIRYAPMAPYFGKGFLTVDGAEWQQSRQHFSHSFSKSSIGDYETYDHYLSLMISKIPRDGSTVDIQDLNFALYTDTSTLFLFGESFESLSRGLDNEAKAFVKSLHKSFEGCGIRQGLGPLKFLYRDPAWKAANAQNHQLVQRWVSKALQRHSTAQTQGHRRKLLIDALAEDIKDPVELRNEAIHAFAAANETTACLISNTMWVLARRPDIWSRLQQEVSTLGDKKLDFDGPMKLCYLQNVINETLRLYPVFPFHSREAARDCLIPKGGGEDGHHPIFIQAGDRFEASFLALHRDPLIWGSDSEEFKPERFETFQPTAWQFVPFGGGARSCLGKQKVLFETSYYVARFVRDFKSIESRDLKPWVGEVKITAKNANGVKVALTPA